MYSSSIKLLYRSGKVVVRHVAQTHANRGISFDDGITYDVFNIVFEDKLEVR